MFVKIGRLHFFAGKSIFEQFSLTGNFFNSGIFYLFNSCDERKIEKNASIPPPIVALYTKFFLT